MNFLPENASIGSLVAKNPEYASIFEKLGLDYCCKGNRTLKEACDEKKLNVIDVLETLKNSQSSHSAVDWDRMSIKEMIEHIVSRYHTYANQELPRISQLLEKLNTKHGQKYPYISELQKVFANMKYSLLDHMKEEEQIVFPLMINLAISNGASQGEVKKYLESLNNDHLETGEALEKIKELTHDYLPPAGACMTHNVMLKSLERLEQNLHEHIHVENHILFPRAKAML